MKGSASYKRSNDSGTLLDELRLLREENARLRALLSRHGIDCEESGLAAKSETVVLPQPSTMPDQQLSTAEKIALFRRLFRGQVDAYPIRWESAKGTFGYVPACGNEWKPGVCKKPRIKCAACQQRLLLPVTDQVIFVAFTDASA